MRSRRSRVVSLVGLLIVGIALGSLTIGLPAVSQQSATLVPTELSCAMVPSRAANILQAPVEGICKLLLDYLQKNGFPEIKTVKTSIPDSYAATVEALGTQKIHVALMGPFQIVQALDLYGVIPVNVTKRGQNLTFRSQFMAHVDSALNTLADFVKAVKDGKTLKFSYGGSSSSTSGFLYPCKVFKDNGILPGNFPNLKTIRAANHLASAIAVYKKDVDVGAAFEDVRTSLDTDQTKKELGVGPNDPAPSTKVKVLGYSDKIPNDGAVAIKELKPELINAIRAGIDQLSKTDDGKKFLAQALDATDFVPTPTKDFDMIEALKAVRVVANEIQPNLPSCERQ